MIMTIVHLRFANRVTGQQLFLLNYKVTNVLFAVGDNIELIPLNLNEKYEFQLEPNTGLEIKFSINEEIRDLGTED
jgi:hypothetical protein